MTAIGTEKRSCKRIVFGFPLAARLSAFNESLHCVIGFSTHDGRVAVFYIVHRLFAVVALLFEWQGLCGDLLLK